ncbi:MAG: 3'-5' exonuclease, partial [Pseudomonadota bacterium]
LFSAVLEQGGRTRLLERLSTEAEDAINVFLGQCLQYEQDHTPSLDGFMHWLGQSDVDVKRDPEAAGDYVRLMTIHGAKGLQAPVVYLADLAGTPRPRAQFVTLTSDKGPRLDVPIFRRNARNDIGPVGAAAEAKKQADYEEYKRLLYVAMTRAEDHLVCAGYAAQTPRSGSMLDAYQLVSAAFDRLEVPSDPQSGVRRYQTGKALEQRDAQTEPVRRSKTQLPAWAHAAPAPEQTPPRPLQPSHMPSDGPTHFPAAQLGGADAALSPARRGTLIHALLEHLPALPEAERFAVGKAYLDRMLSPAESDAANAMLTEALMVLDMPSASAFFAAESKAEVPIIARLGDFLVSGKVDRLAVTRDAVLFADFKTTEQAPPSAAQTAPATLRQMALYQASLQKVFEGKPVKAALIWTAEPRVDWLDAVWLLPYLPPGANTAFTRASA